MIKLILIPILLLLSGCASKYDYSIHKPKVRFKPSIKAIKKLNRETIGHRYVWGAENDGKYDCSGLTYYTLGSMGIEIPRVANDQFHKGTPVSINELQKGDLVFFATSKRRPGVATHVGIYIGNGKFQHASSSKKRVVISSLNSRYYRSHYIGARRYYNFCRPKPKQEYIAYKKPTNTHMEQVTQIKPYNVETNSMQNSSYNQNQNPFVKADNSNLNSATNGYYLMIPSKEPNNLLTKLQLSGLNASLDGNGNIIVGYFSSKSEAIEVKNRNYKLLSNAIIRG